ncbi:hypothetical protein BBBOND_0300020 [Babesia bigemina]|uniref:C3H1-type domain-containing protein n=1 Tax=Babesia bigemina TaxID=5866 RepID=A0A061D7X1_BABBI|nr:hypothetical protein BBBOND_0300020 [Babesia bigemina]CDR96097.1 hypothetical protein BBBOND_0300020 [Babesia bigemina]|eukprot:XP_012768283.1 hypothetical protein BBBOND_0300020 [Babesia bigemina]
MNIQAKLADLHRRICNIPTNGDADTKEIARIIKYLEEIPEQVEERRRTALTKMMALESNIDLLHKLLDNVDVNVTLAETDIQSSIDSINNALKQAVAKCQATISSAFSTLTAAVRTLFAEQKKADLHALKGVVEEQMKVIEGIIDKDKRTGIKGLLKAVNGMKVTIISSDSPTFPTSTTELLDNIKKDLPLSTPFTKGHFTQLSTKFHDYYKNVDTYIKDQVKPPTSPPPTNPASKLTKIKDDFDKLLTHLSASNSTKKYNYDNTFVSLLNALSSSLHSLSPSAFANPRHPELLDAVRAGLQGFVEEMERVYVNGYDGHEEGIKFDELVIKGSDKDEKLSDDGRNLSKVFLTILETLYHDFVGLQNGCKKDASGNTQQLCQYVEANGKRNSNRLGSWLKERGYNVPSTKDKQDGELNSKKTGKDIYDELLIKKLENASSNTILTTWKTTKNSGTAGSTSNDDITLLDILGFFHDQLLDYFKTSHLRHISAPKAPCNVYQMLQWLTGLRHNPMYEKLCAHFKGLFKKPEGDKAQTESAYKLESTDAKLNAEELSTMLRGVCNISVDVLVAIQGHGHADGVYAVDFYVNSEGLSYPSNPGQCFDLLVDVASRVYHQMLFVYKQCNNGPQSSGWSDCHYGRGIAGSAWNCNTLQCPDQECKQKHDQTADQHYKCGVKSPLQSFLEDGLPGFLPHQFTKPGCKLECAVPNHFGKPCLTPMGFADIGIAASHTKQGKHLKEVLEKFCGNADQRLTKLCSMLTCLLQKPPQTLGDIFAFYHKFLNGWDGSGKHRKDAFDESVDKANFKRHYDKLNAYSVFDSTHSSNSKSHSNGDLVSLVCHSTPSGRCGPYLYSLYNEISGSFSKKHADKYVSWIVYLTPTFYDLLKKLYDDCCKSCGGDRPKCRVAKCPPTCATTKNTQNTNHSELCKSILQCDTTASVLCRYGFALSDRTKLSGTEKAECKRTCKDLCEMLKKVLDEESVLMKLFHSIDKFIYTIRFPFMTLTLALWLLSLLYLLHIMVIRLDLLHIKSHLHSPSSHRIAAQSLLAAARVNKFNRVFYLQP